MVNAMLTGQDNPLIDVLLELVDKFGGVEEINRKATESGRLEARLERLGADHSPCLDGLRWLIEQRDRGAFVSLPEYRRRVLGDAGDEIIVDEHRAVTLEIS